jgi:hypothetical protein
MVQLWCVTCFLHPSHLTSNLQVPQLWNSSLQTNGDKDILTCCVVLIAALELEKEWEEIQKAEECKALAEAKLKGREAHAVLKAQFKQERAAAAEAKKLKKAKLVTKHWAEKARAAADSKARQGGRKVIFLLILALRTFAEHLISLRPSNRRRYHRWSTASQVVNNMFCQHQGSRPRQHKMSIFRTTSFKMTSSCSTLRTLLISLSSALLCSSLSGIALLTQT